jgi:Zn-dependent peptidase ImmA (M78 family)
MKRRDDQLHRQLASTVGTLTTTDAIERLALKAQLDNFGRGWTAWRKRAFGLGVAEIHLKDLRGIEGKLLRSKDGDRIIEINANRPRTRQLFSLAHEVAHILLERELPQLGSDLKHRTLFDPDYRAEEERIADRLAAAMLMPQDSVNHLVLTHGFGLASVLRVAREFQVSIPAAAIRVWELTGRKFVLLRFIYNHRDDTILLRDVPVLRAPFRMMILRPWVIRRCEVGIAPNSCQVTNVSMPLPVGSSQNEVYHAEAHWLNRGCLAVMVTFDHNT